VAGDEPGGGADGTVIRYPPAQAAAADLVARWLVGPARLVPVEPDTGAGTGTGGAGGTGAAGTEGSAEGQGIELVTGVDWQGVRSEARPSSTTTTPTTLPEGTTTTTGSDGSSTTEETTGERTTTSVDLATLDC
jgi:hypothetical protein